MIELLKSKDFWIGIAGGLIAIGGAYLFIEGNHPLWGIGLLGVGFTGIVIGLHKIDPHLNN